MRASLRLQCLKPPVTPGQAASSDCASPLPLPSQQSFAQTTVWRLRAPRALTERGVRVPDEVSTIGWDNQPFSEFTWPALTTVAPDFGDLGARAFRLLQMLLAGSEEVQDSIVTPHLLERESTTTASGRVRTRS